MGYVLYYETKPDKVIYYLACVSHYLHCLDKAEICTWYAKYSYMDY